MIRVMRLMQYEYADIEAAVNDMARWSVQGVKVHGYGSKRMVIKSTVLPIELNAEECKELSQDEKFSSRFITEPSIKPRSYTSVYSDELDEIIEKERLSLDELKKQQNQD